MFTVLDIPACLVDHRDQQWIKELCIHVARSVHTVLYRLSHAAG